MSEAKKLSMGALSTAILARLRSDTAPAARPASMVLLSSHSTPPSPMRPRQRLSEEGWMGRRCWKKVSPVKCWKYGF